MAVVAIVIVLIAASLVTWYSLFGRLDKVAAEAAKVGRIKVRVIHHLKHHDGLQQRVPT